MQAITTKYLPATNAKGSRIKATAEAGSITIPYSYEVSEAGAHRLAAEALTAKLGWTTDSYGPLIGGGLPNNSGYVFVFNNSAAY